MSAFSERCHNSVKAVVLGEELANAIMKLSLATARDAADNRDDSMAGFAEMRSIEEAKAEIVAIVKGIMGV